MGQKTKSQMRVVLDTNVIVSGLAKPDSIPGLLLKRWRERGFMFLSCEEQIAEIRRVTRYSRLAAKLTPSRVGNTVYDLRKFADMVPDLPEIDASPDPFDNYLLAMAQAGGANYLVTGDKADLLALGRHASTRIVSVRQFAEVLGI